MTSRRRPVPADWAIKARRLGPQALMDHYRAGYDTVRRWIRETGVVVPQRIPAPIPADFADTHDMTQSAAAARYGVSVDIVRRWDGEAGIDRRAEWISRMTRMARSRSMSRPALAGAMTPRAQPVRTAKLPTPFDATKRDWSAAGQAADFLRRFGPVARCDESGRYDPKGNHWRRGSSILTAADVIARAERNGWQRDAWSKLA